PARAPGGTGEASGSGAKQEMTEISGGDPIYQRRSQQLQHQQGQGQEQHNWDESDGSGVGSGFGTGSGSGSGFWSRTRSASAVTGPTSKHGSADTKEELDASGDEGGVVNASSSSRR
ncbi:hypothetical protein BGZ95_002858, partial [Linnemannia exigua]